MEPQTAKVLETKTVFTLPLGSLLVLSWHAEGARAGAAEIIAKKPGALVFNVWKPGANGFGAGPEVWILKAEGLFLVDSRKGFRCTLRTPSEKELVSIQEHKKRFPAPSLPLEGQYVHIRFDVELRDAELPDVVGTVTAQRFQDMTVDACYYSVKQGKIIHESIDFDRAAAGWIDDELRIECTVTVIDRARFDHWLAEDEKTQKAKTAPVKASAPADKPASKSEAEKPSISKNPKVGKVATR
jgi:hypothetical protein